MNMSLPYFSSGPKMNQEVDQSEIDSWQKKHSLCISGTYKKPVDFLEGSKLLLGYHDNDLEQKQYFITDKQSTLEFREVEDNKRALTISESPPTNYVIDTEFVCDNEVLERINEVNGCTNYSSALRNSEHVSRYIHSGTWFSYQMASGCLRKKYCKDMSLDVKALINKLPAELHKTKVCRKVLYQEIETDYVKFENQMDILLDEGRDSFNIVLLGITGSGKSSLINNLFNQEVAQSGAKPSSITRSVYFFQGTYIGSKLDEDIDKQTLVEYGSDAYNQMELCTPDPKEDFFTLPDVKPKRLDQFSSQSQTIIDDIQTISKEQEEKATEIKDLVQLVQKLYISKDPNLRSKILETKRMQQDELQLNEKMIELLDQLERKTSNNVCIIDTVGLCDTFYTNKQIYDKIQKSVNTKMAFIDKVVIICSGRIEKTTADAIKQYMSWMEYQTHKKNFVFIYNKCDDMTEADKEESLLAMCELLQADMEVEDIVDNPDGSRRTRKYVLATAFPPCAEYSDVEEDLNTIKETIFARPKTRIMLKARNNNVPSCNII